jgi:signal peptidase II
MKKKIFKKKNIFLLTIIFFIFFFDRLSKNKILSDLSDSAFYVNKFLNIDLIWNTGIGFGLFSFNTPLAYNMISIFIAVIIIILFYTCIISEKLDSLIFSIIIGGALGNFYDRLVFNAVPDFIDLHYGDFHWFTFNVADIFITVGIIAFIAKNYFIKNTI